MAMSPPVGAQLTSTQARSAQAIVNLFETGSVLGDYGQVTLIPGDTGHLTYGRSQTTLGSGNLAALLQRYCANLGARFGARLAQSLPRFVQRDLSLDTDNKIHNLLRACADDPVMRETQDAFFDDAYWRPALAAASRLGIISPLGVAVVYDSAVHGSWALIRDRTIAVLGDVAKAGEPAWIQGYVSARRQWMATHKRADIRATVYRMDAFQRLIDQGFWGLELPLVVRGQEISTATLAAVPPGCYDGPLPGSRVLSLQSPLARGLDVRRLQLGLSDLGADIKADGVFGQASLRCVKDYQARSGLPATGVADVALIAKIVG
ncbi:MAG: peptidoglycan-binding protein [Variovorax sp.]|nr:peptidoglycan-binding protein [Variovorax sp.]